MATQLGTGAEGFIGNELSRTLVAAGHEVVSTMLGDGAPHDLPPQVRIVSCDVTDAKAVRDVVATVAPATIYHLAAQSNPVLSWAKPTETIRTNVLGTVHLLDAVVVAGLSSRVFIAASSAEYGYTARPGH
ncbi:NAD-dependent epimerase/dehydratase, partial [mine drainage metagenome]